MGRLVVIDGIRHQPEEAKVSVYDRGFLYGDSVFETVRTYGGRPFALTEHIRRLGHSASLLGIRMPLSLGELAAEVERAIEQAANPESLVRVMLSRGAGPLGLDPSAALRPLRVVIIEPLELPPPEYYREGIAVITVQTVRASDAAHSAKLGNYLASALALRDACAEGAAEALVVNRDGFVVEGTTSNVFAVRRAKAPQPELLTPPLDVGVLAGITRQKVIDVARQQRLEVRFEPLRPAELCAADEVFLTSSVRELLPVVRVDGERVGDGHPGPVTRALHLAFRRHLGLVGIPDDWR